MKKILLLAATIFCFLNLINAQPGELDSSFGNHGVVKNGSVNFYTIAIQKDGKAVAAGSIYTSNGASFAIARYNIDGSPDNTFSSDGIQTTDFSSGYSRANSVVIQSDGKIVAAGDYALARYNTDGSLDNTFSGDGKQTTDTTVEIRSVAIQKDGKIVVAGRGGNYLNGFTIARYNTDGSLDKTFGKGGRRIVPFYPEEHRELQEELASSIAIQNDGKIVVIGFTREDYGESYIHFQIPLVRLNTDGGLDNTFGKGGKTYGPGYYGSPTDIIYSSPSVVIQNDGKIVIASKDRALNSWRFNTDGSIDSSFDMISGSDYYGNGFFSSSVALQGDGKIVLAGDDLLRYNTNGSLDSTFNINAKQKIDFQIQDIAIGNNKLYATGESGAVARYFLDPLNVSIITPDNNATYIAPANIKINVTASDKNGTISKVEFYNGTELLHTATVASYNFDWKDVPVGNYTLTAKAYDNISQVTTSAAIMISVTPSKAPTVRITTPANNADYLAGANIKINVTASDKDGTISKVEFYNGTALLHTETVAPYGFTWKDVPVGNYTLTAKATDNSGVVTTSAAVYLNLINAQPGGLDPSFGTNGIVKNDSVNNLYTTAIQKDGKIVVAGIYNYNNPAVARYSLDGSLDNTFSGDGIQAFDNYQATSVAVQSDGKIVAAGSYNLARYNTDGSLDNTFSGDGKQTSDIVGIHSIAIQQDGKIVVAGRVGEHHSGFAIARYNTNGSVDKTFGKNGTQIVLFKDEKGDDAYAYASSVAIQNDGKIVVIGIVYNYNNENFQIRLVRLNMDGSLDNTFGDYGKKYTGGGGGGFWAYGYSCSVVIQNDGKIITAGVSRSGSIQRTFLGRFNTDGSIDSNFDVKSSFNSYNSGTNSTSIALQNDGKIVVSGADLLRFNTNGGLDSTFNTQAQQKVDFMIYDIAIANNKLYAVGDQFDGSQFHGIIARYLLDSNSNKPPAVTLSTPFVKYSAPASIKLHAEATDEDGTISKVEFYNGTTLLHTETVIPYGYLWKSVPVGNYTLTAKAYDNSGNVTTSDAIKVSVVSYNVPPVVSIVKPADNQTYGAHASVRFVAKAKDPNDTISKVEFFSNNILIRTENYYPYTYWWDYVQAGTYTITAVVTDAQGLSSTSEAIHITVEPNEAPTVSIITPTNHQTFTSPATINLEATAKDMDGTIHKVEFYNGKTLLATEKLSPYTFTWKDVPAGNYTITAKTFDNEAAPATSVINITVTSQGASIVSSRPSAKDSKTGENSAISLKLYPNPAKNVLSINTTGLQQSKPSSISVISASGVVVKTMQSNASNRVVQLDVSSLISGVYTVKIMSGDKVLYKQFVKL